jgi:hypothetical protein
MEVTRGQVRTVRGMFKFPKSLVGCSGYHCHDEAVHPSVVATLSFVILLSVRNSSSTCWTISSVAVSTGRPNLASSATFERPWANLSISCESPYATITSHLKEETFLYEYNLHWVLFPTKTSQQNLSLQQYAP